MAYGVTPDSQTFATQVPYLRDAAAKRATNFVEFTKPSVYVPATVAATGSAQTDAAAVPLAAFVYVTAANATKGVILPATAPGTKIHIHNVANAVLKLYPHSGGDINDGTQDAAFSVPAKVPCVAINIDGVTWSLLVNS